MLAYPSTICACILVTGIVPGILRHLSHDGCDKIFKTVPGAWQMEDGRRLPLATLRHLTAIWKPGFKKSLVFTNNVTL